MAENSKKEKFLIPLKNICSQIVAEPQKCSQLIKDLWAYTEKGEFYKFYVFVLSLETIADDTELPLKAVKDFLKLIEKLLNEGVDNKDAIFSRLYNFAKSKNRLDIIDCLVPICSFKVDPILSNKTYLFLLSEILFKLTTTKENRQAMVENFRNHISNYSQDKDLSVKLFQCVYRITCNFVRETNWSEALNFLKGTIVCSAVNGTLKIPSDEAYDEILNMLMILVKCSQENSDVFQLCLDMTTNVSSLLMNETQQTCDAILVKVFTMCCDGIISNDGTRKLFLSHYNKVDPQGVLHEKTALLIGKVFENNIRMLEASSEFFSTYHFFVVKLFHILRSIKNKDGVVSCCDDVKRHSIIELSKTIIGLASEVVKTTKLNESFTQNLVTQVTFIPSFINGMKCQSKHKKTFQMYERIYNLLYDIVTRKLIGNKLEHISLFANTMMKLWDDLPESVKSSSSDPELLALIVYENPSNEKDAKICANEIASMMVKHKDLPAYLDSSKEQKKKLMKLMSVLRQSTKLLKHVSATEYLQKNYSNTCGAFLGTFALIEMTTVKRYNPEPDHELMAELFSKLDSLTKCPLTLAQACQNVGDEVIKKIPSNLFKKVNISLEAEEKKRFNLQVSLSLALNNYSIFFTGAEKAKNNSKADDGQTFEGLNLNEELEILKNLNDSLLYFTDVVAHLIKHKDEIDQIMSIKSLAGIIKNLAFQFYIRGFKYKDLEAFTLLWHISLMEGNQKHSMLSVATFFLDNHELLTDSSGNYIKLSKKIKPLSIEEILAETNALIDELFLTNFTGENPNTQCSVWSYLLSLWVYYLRQGRQSDGQKRWNQFKTTWSSTNFTDENSRHEVIKAKVYFCVVEISMKCYQRSADNFLSQGVSVLVSANKINGEFSYIYYQIFNHIAIKGINYSLNRLDDMTHYNAVMEQMIASAAKKRFCFKVINLLSLSIIRNLNMEKIDKAKTLLKEITMIIGLKEEILVESPPKAVMSTAAIHRELFNEQIRKVELSSGPLKPELSMVYQNQSTHLIKQLISFIHKETCECDICKVPQLKFTMFQIGCHYSRLMWMINKFEVSRIFNEYALGSWRNICDKLRRLKYCELLAVDKIDFAVFSIRWLFQIADTLVTLRMFEDVEEIYQEVELVCTTNIPDYDCFKEILHVRKENLNFLLENRSEELTDKAESELSFSVFIETREKSTKDFSTPELMIHRGIQQKHLDSRSSDVIYIDSDDGGKIALSKPAPKTTKKNLSQIVKQSSKTPKTRTKPTPKTAPKPESRKIKVSVNDETPVTRKTRRML